jgi:hypothetical protein
MKMIPLVRATEPGKAQLVNLELSGSRIVVLISITSVGLDVSLFGRMCQRG